MTVTPLTQEEAFDLHDFVDERIFGWNVAMYSCTKRGFRDGRTKETKNADRLLQDVIFNRPDFDDYVAALMRGEDPADQWPEAFREFIRFCIHHRCPREINEPFSEYGIEKRTEMQGMPMWPDFLRKYDNTATLSEMPEPPPPSDEYKAWEAGRRG